MVSGHNTVRHRDDAFDYIRISAHGACFDSLEGASAAGQAKLRGTFTLRFTNRYSPRLQHGGNLAHIAIFSQAIYGFFRHGSKWQYLPYVLQ